MITRKLLLSVAMYFAFASFAYSYTIQFDRDDVTISKQDGYDRVSMKHLSPTSSNDPDELGKPEVPYKVISLIIPQGSEVASISTSSFGQRLTDREILLYPQQPPEKLSEINTETVFYEPNKSAYESDELYPREIIEVLDTGDFDGVNRIVRLAIYPVQYNPQNKELIFHENISFSLNTYAGRQSNLKAKQRRPSIQEEYDKILESMVYNPEDIPRYGYRPPAKAQGIEPVRKTADAELPYYEYVIITDTTFVSYCTDLVNWIKRSGLSCGVVTIDDIHENNNYYEDDIGENGVKITDVQAEIRHYLWNALDHGCTSYGTTSYVLLLGDEGIVPVRYGCITTKSGPMYIPADLYYADLTGDWQLESDTPVGEESGDNIDKNAELFVGRIPCNEATDITNWIEKRLIYEQNPGLGQDLSRYKEALWSLSDEFVFDYDYMGDMESVFEQDTNFNHTWRLEYDDDEFDGMPEDFTGSDIITDMNTKPGLITFMCHGSDDFLTTMTEDTINVISDISESGIFFNGIYSYHTDGSHSFTHYLYLDNDKYVTVGKDSIPHDIYLQYYPNVDSADSIDCSEIILKCESSSQGTLNLRLHAFDYDTYISIDDTTDFEYVLSNLTTAYVDTDLPPSFGQVSKLVNSGICG